MTVLSAVAHVPISLRRALQFVVQMTLVGLVGGLIFYHLLGEKTGNSL